MKRSLFLFVLLLGCTTITFGQLLWVDNFDDPVHVVGTPLDTNTSGWKVASGSGGDTIAAGLTFTGYPGSGLGNSIQLFSISGAKVVRTFTAQTSGSVYASFMFNMVSGGSSYFFNFSTNPGDPNNSLCSRTSAYTNTTGDSIAFSIQHAKASTAGTSKASTEMNYLVNTTYIVVVKYTINSGTLNDASAMYIFDSNSGIPATEPTTPTLGPVTDASYADLGDASGAGVGCGSVMLRQSNGPNCYLDGIRIATTWESAITTGVDNKSDAEQPTSFALGQNYPNPFNPSTNFTYQIGNAGFVSMKIYNVLGQEVSTLVNEYKRAGSYQTAWNASRFDSGIYFCKMQSGTFSDTKKIIFMK